MRIQPRKILCAIDFSEFTDMVIRYGKALAKEYEAQLYLCHVVPSAVMVSSHMTPYIDFTNIETHRVDQAQERLNELADKFGLNENDVRIEIGTPAEAIERLVQEDGFDMAIAATHGGSGFKRYLIGSVTDRLVKILSCPLLVLHPTEHEKKISDDEKIRLKKILVGCDFSEDSGLAFDYALSLAQEFQTELYLAHVVQIHDSSKFSNLDYIRLQEGDSLGWNRSDFMALKAKSEAELEKNKKSLFARFERKLESLVPEDSKSWCKPTAVVLEGQPYEALIDYAKKNDIDMIVLGVRGHGLIESFLIGSTTDRVISRARCPVLAIRQSKRHADQQESREAMAVPEKEPKPLTAAQVMRTDNIITVKPETKITQAVGLFLEHHVNGLPVLDDDGNLVGIICQSDLIVQQKEIPMPAVFSMLDSFIPLTSPARQELEIEKMSAATVSQAMARDPLSASLDTPVSKIAEWMVEKHFYTIPVVDNRKLVGVIGKEDILRIMV